MASREITVTKRLQALVVSIIRRLWDHGHLHNNQWANAIYHAWLHHWVDVKTAITMASVDRQAEALTPEPEVVKPVYWEEEEGETALEDLLATPTTLTMQRRCRSCTRVE